MKLIQRDTQRKSRMSQKIGLFGWKTVKEKNDCGFNLDVLSETLCVCETCIRSYLKTEINGFQVPRSCENHWTDKQRCKLSMQCKARQTYLQLNGFSVRCPWKHHAKTFLSAPCTFCYSDRPRLRRFGKTQRYKCHLCVSAGAGHV